MTEAVLVQLDPEPATQVLDRLGDLHADRENHHFEAFLVQVPCLVLIAEQQIAGGGILVQPADTATGVADPVAVPGSLEVAPVALGERPHVHHEHVDVQIGLVLLGHDRFLGGVHAAHRRAVVVGLVARAHALQEGDPLGCLVVGGPLDVASRGAGGRQQPFELHCRYHVGIPAQPVLLRHLGPVDLVAGGENDGTDRQLLGAGHHVVVDGIDATRKRAAHALGADAACQAAGRFGPGRFIVVAALDLGEAADAVLNGQARQRHSRLPFDMTELFLRQVYHRQGGPAGRLEVLALEIADDRPGGAVAALDGFDHERRARDAVAGCEDTFTRGGQSVRVDGDRVLGRDSDSGVVRDERQPGPLADREDHGVAGDDVGRIRHRRHLQPALVVEAE